MTLDEDRIITRQYYTSLLNHLNEKIREKQENKEKGIFLHRFYTPAQSSAIVPAKLFDCTTKFFTDPLLVSFSTFILLPDVHKWNGLLEIFVQNDEVIGVISGYFED